MRQRLEQRARVRYIEPEAFVMIALGLGDTTRALDELEHAVRIRSFFLPFITVDPVYAPLAHNPRFLEIVRTVGLKFPANVR